MKLRKLVCMALLVGLLLGGSPAWSAKDRTNFPYVQSIETGVFYARCIPDEAEGTKGTTKIYCVYKDQDKLVDSYDFYTKSVVLAWSPIVGKVAVMALGGAPTAERIRQTEFSFYIGGKFLHSYTLKDLKDWGGDILLSSEGTANFKVLGPEQIPGTNEYVFSIEIKGKKFSFDILTGKPYVKAE